MKKEIINTLFSVGFFLLVISALQYYQAKKRRQAAIAGGNSDAAGIRGYINECNGKMDLAKTNITTGAIIMGASLVGAVFFGLRRD